MKDFVDFLESAEKLAYKILFWIILVPKTLWRIIVNPDWVPGYINREIKREQSAFDEYISPIILLLFVALIPTLIVFILPELGLAISSPAETASTLQRQVEFDAQAMFVSGSKNMRDRYTWYVEVLKIDEKGGFVYDQDGYLSYREIYRETYHELTNKTTILFDGKAGQPLVFEHEQNTFLTRTNNSSRDQFWFLFDVPGSYFVNVEVERFDINRQDVAVEEYRESTYVYVMVPENPDELISITNYAPKGQPEETPDVFSERTIMLMALALLTPPLLFAFVIRVLTREKVSANSLKENFYIQCYYFSPLSLTSWATLYGWYFYTIDIFSYNHIYGLTLFLPLTWAALWFIYAETYALAAALKTSVWKSFSTVMLCTSIMIGCAFILFYLVFYDQNDLLRKGLIWAYPLLFHLALLGLILFRFLSGVAGLIKLSGGDVILLLLYLPSIFFFVGGSLLGVVALPATPTPTVTPLLVLPTAGVDTAVPQIPVSGIVVPVATTTPAFLPSAEGKPATYVLHNGEFPYCIARRFDVHPAQLLASSGLADGYAVPAGTMLSIPRSSSPFPGNRSLNNHPTTYIVSATYETLYSIACLFGDVEPTAIASANGISSDVNLSVGQQLQIP